MGELQAFFDDSGSDTQSEAFVLAGWLAPVENWRAFSVEWRDELRRDRALKFFKMSEAVGLHDQFDGWDPRERDRKVLALGEIIRKHALVRMGVGVNRRHYDNLIKPIGFPQQYFTDPYFMLFYECVIVVSRAIRELDNPPSRCELIFDKHGKVGNRARRYWDKAIAGFAKIGFPGPLAEPAFADDIDEPPLQAADMFAWMGRDRGLAGDAECHLVEPLMTLWKDLPGRTKHLSHSSLAELAAGFVVANARAVSKKNPQPLSPAELRRRFPFK